MFQINSRLILLGLFFIVQNSFSQVYYPLVSTFSQPGVYGTARVQGLGGCGVAMGADLSCAAMNPAGLGLYNKNDVGISMSIGSASSNTAYSTDTETDNARTSRAWFSMPNLGIAFHHDANNPNSAFKGGTFAITFNKTSNFQNQISYSGVDNNHSMMEYLAEQSNGTSYSNVQADQPYNGTVQTFPGLAYYSNLITSNGVSSYYTNFPITSFQNQGTATSKKGQYQWNFAYGFNINNRLYLGATVGIGVLNYILQTDHNEVSIPTSQPQNLINFEFQQYDQSQATTINLKLGGQYKVSDRFRLAATIMTPTSYSIKENYSNNLNSYYYVSGGTNQNNLSLATQYFTYKYVAPPRVELGGTFLLNRSGLITVGAEYLPYKMTYFNNPTFISSPGLSSFDKNNNQAIQNYYKNVFNIKGGIELRSGVNYFRAGCAYIPNPMGTTSEGDQWIKGYGNQWNFTAGWGIRTSNYYFDITAINTRMKSQYSPYNLYSGGNSVTYAPIASSNTSIIQLIATFGILY